MQVVSWLSSWLLGCVFDSVRRAGPARLLDGRAQRVHLPRARRLGGRADEAMLRARPRAPCRPSSGVRLAGRLAAAVDRVLERRDVACTAIALFRSPALTASHRSTMSCGMNVAKPTSAPSTPCTMDASRYSSWQVRIALRRIGLADRAGCRARTCSCRAVRP